MPVLDFPDLGLIDVPEGVDIGKAAEAAKRFVRTTKTSPSPQPMTSAQMGVTSVTPAAPLVAAPPTLQGAIPQDAGIRAQTTMDQLRQYRDTMGRLIAPAVGMNFDEMSADAAKGILRQVVAFHGSPHTFDTFDASKIGTGEGAQAYGHGLYFAENPEVAKQYARDLSQKDQGILTIRRGANVIAKGDQITNQQLEALKLLDQGKQAAGQFPHNAAYYAKKMTTDPEMQTLIDNLKDATSSYEPLRPNLYTTTIPDEHAANMLNWDAPLNEQPDVLAKLKNIPGVEQWWNKPGGGATSGEGLYHALTEDLGGKPAASKALQDAGIPGIKYLDQGSRTAGQGTRNFVVFDPAILQDVTRK